MDLPVKPNQNSNGAAKKPPFRVSVVIPMRNEELSLPELILSLQKQTRRADEIVLVDAGSTDGTVAVAQKLLSDEANARVLEAGPAPPGRARNVGIAAAQHEWLALTDAGIHVEPQWLEKLAAVAQASSGIDFVYGNFEPIIDSFFVRCAAIAYVAPKRMTTAGLMRFPSIASALLRREVWQQVGGFADFRAGEDLLFMHAVERKGFTVGYAPQATVHWNLQPTIATTFKKFVNYSRHNVWAGLQRFWHYGVARHYLLALPFVVLAIFHRWWWLIIPLLELLARTIARIWRYGEGGGLGRLWNPFQVLTVAFIIVTIDVATFVGWAQALLSKPPRANAA